MGRQGAFRSDVAISRWVEKDQGPVYSRMRGGGLGYREPVLQHPGDRPKTENDGGNEGDLSS